jgi:hypothetical protein
MTKEQADMFLEGKFMLQMSTLDEKGEPNVQPVWFYHDKVSIKKKMRNVVAVTMIRSMECGFIFPIHYIVLSSVCN